MSKCDDDTVESNFDIKIPLISQFSQVSDSNHKIFMLDDEEFIEEYSQMINNDAIIDKDSTNVDNNYEYLSTTLCIHHGQDNGLYYI